MIASVLLLVLQTAAPAADPAPVGGLRWKEQPSLYDRWLAIPDHARSLEGRAVLRCRVNSLGRPADCKVTSETPPGAGFGKAAMKLRAKMRFWPPQPGQDPWVDIPVEFNRRAPYLLPSI